MHNISGNLLVDLKKLWINVFINLKSSPGRKDYDQVLYQGNVDVCKISEGAIANFLVKALLKRNSDYSIQCPIKKGFYYLYNHANSNISFIPGVMPNADCDWAASFKMNTKFSKVASALQLIFVKVYGEARY